MDLDVLLLANAVQAPNALFEQFRIQREVEQDEMMRKLEITSFAANLRTDSQPRAVRFSEPGSVTIPLYQGESFVKNTRFNGQMTAKGFIKGFGFFDGATDYQHLLWIQFLQQRGQPKNARVADQIGIAL